jgi:hypothetical protein
LAPLSKLRWGAEKTCKPITTPIQTALGCDKNLQANHPYPNCAGVDPPYPNCAGVEQKPASQSPLSKLRWGGAKTCKPITTPIQTALGCDKKPASQSPLSKLRWGGAKTCKPITPIQTALGWGDQAATAPKTPPSSLRYSHEPEASNKGGGFLVFSRGVHSSRAAMTSTLHEPSSWGQGVPPWRPKPPPHR